MDAIDVEVGVESCVGLVQIEIDLEEGTGAGRNYGLEESGCAVKGEGHLA
jgi:hypothetical protein